MYILKNLRSLIENSRLIFILIIICITASTLVIQFSYGIYQNYHVVIEQGESEYKQISIEFDNKLNDYVKLFQVLECISQFSPELYENINYCSIGQNQDSFRSSYGIKEITDDDDPTTDPAKTNYFYVSFDDNGNLTDCKTIKSNFINNKFMEGRWFEEDEWDQGKKVCLVGLGGGIQRIAPFVDENHKPLYNISHDGIVEQNSYTDEFGDTYEVIGITQIGTSVFPIYSVNQNYRIDIFYFELFQPITAEQYKELSEILESKLGHYVQMPDVEFSESKNIYLYKTILIICGLVSLAAGINFIILFNLL